VRQRYHYVSLFVPFVNIAMSFGSLFERIASIDDRSDLTRLDQLFEKEQILFTIDGYPDNNLFAACQ
jgi:hypothetical protein